MAWRTTADPERFNEAVDWFANRVPVAFWQSVLGPATARRAFTVAGVVELDVVTAIWALLTETIANGDGLDVFKRRARDEIARWRASGDLLETVYRTNVQTAYNRGRWHQMGRPEVVRHRPYWLYDAVMDLRTTRDICRPLNGTIRQHSSTFWQTHHPPLHHRCRS
ncbi:MAG: hypothetical protein GVY18_07640, partial [Bacteroidetes bacterium]|nr:hypothetical protein [Bacteroidota bacterium]